MAQAVTFLCQTEKFCVRLEVISTGICGGLRGTETGFSSGTSVPFSPWLRRIAAILLQKRTGFEFRLVNLFAATKINFYPNSPVYFSQYYWTKVHIPLHLLLYLPEKRNVNHGDR